MRRPMVLALAALGGAVVALPVVAGSASEPTIEAVNTAGAHAWSPTQVTIAASGAVTVSNNTSVEHGVEWVAGPETPSCGGSVPVGHSAAASGTHWSGSCAFTKPGTYVFYCTVHGPEMTGRVVVEANGTVTTATTGPSPTTTSATTTTGSSYTSGSSTTYAPAGTYPGGGYPTTGHEAPAGTGGSGSSPFAGGARALGMAGAMRGSSVHGSIDVSSAGAGGKLEVTLLASRASVARADGRSSVRVGRLVRKPVRAGRRSFAVALDGQGRAALHRRHRLAVTVHVVLTPRHGAPASLSRGVVLRF